MRYWTHSSTQHGVSMHNLTNTAFHDEARCATLHSAIAGDTITMSCCIQHDVRAGAFLSCASDRCWRRPAIVNRPATKAARSAMTPPRQSRQYPTCATVDTGDRLATQWPDGSTGFSQYSNTFDHLVAGSLPHVIALSYLLAPGCGKMRHFLSATEV